MEFSSADAQTAAEITLTDDNAETVTLASHERLVVLQGNLSMEAAVGQATLFDDADEDGAIDAGERIVELNSETGGGVEASIPFDYNPHGHGCSIGLVPKVKAANAGQVSLTGAAVIVNGESEGERPGWREDNFGQ